MSDDGRSLSPNPQSRYVCHICNTDIIPNLPAYTCPNCGEGFIEELTNSRVIDISDDEDDPVAGHGHSHAHLHFHPSAAGMSEQQQNIVQQMFSRIYHPNNQTTHTMSHNLDNGARAHIRVSTNGNNINSQMLNGIFENIIGGLHHVNNPNVQIGTMFPGGNIGTSLHGNLGDYAWGAGGIDNIITQLMNQMENTGVPPATSKDINKLENSKITQDHVDKQTQCSVCMEYFSVGENVKRLKCTHMFHQECIVPWLKIHSTCPVCRKGLDGMDPKENQSPEGPSGSRDAPIPIPRRGYQEEDFD